MSHDIRDKAPLIQHLTNGQFVQIAQKLTGEGDSAPQVGRAPRQGARICCCGCDELVAPPRKFVDQDHYSKWLSEWRYFGKNHRG